MNSVTLPTDRAADFLIVSDLNNQERSNVMIFKTDIGTRKKTREVSPKLVNHQLIYNWSIDTNDMDNVLRIESSEELKE